MYDKKTNESIKNYNRIAEDYDNTFDGHFTNSLKREIVKQLKIEKCSIGGFTTDNGMHLPLRL